MLNLSKLIRFVIMLTLSLFMLQPATGQSTSVNNGYEKGLMHGAYKTGLWQYYDSLGVLELEVDYSEGVLTYLRRDTTDFVIFKDGHWVQSKVDIPPRFIGSTVGFYTILNENVDYPMQAWYRDLVGKVYISFEVDTLGKATNFTIINDIGGECGWEFERVLHLVPNYWLVAEKDGERYRSRFLISCDFRIIMDGKPLKGRKRKNRKNQAETIQLPLAKELPGISYTVKKGYNPED